MFPSISHFLCLPGLLLAIGIASTPAQGFEAADRLLVANKGDQTLSIVDPGTNKQVAVVAEHGITGHEVVASIDGRRAFVPL